MRDFTFNTFYKLLESLKNTNIEFFTFKDFMAYKFNLFELNKYKPNNNMNLRNVVILRHDVDLHPENSLVTAEIEKELDIKGTYYFRIIPKSFHFNIINKIVGLGHEIGYHYEDVDLVLKSQKSKVKNQIGAINEEKLIDLAYENFCKNLETFKKNFDVKTICMHGSPLSKYDNKIIWKKYDYKALDLLGEPYFDINWDEFGYITDTGRRWNASDSSVRDKVNSKYKFNFKSTQNIINNIELLPNHLMFTFHPQRWNDKLLIWTRELISQNVKNVIKKSLVVIRK